MANLAINALTAKTPTTTDLIPVANPTTGIAGKSTVSQIIYSDISSPVTVSSVGAFSYDFYLGFTMPSAFQFQGVVYGASGKSCSTFITNLIQQNVTSLTLSGITNAGFTLPSGTNWPSLTSFSLPDAVICSSFPTTITFSTLDLPSLKIISGAFTPTATALTSISALNNVVLVTGNWAPTINNAAVTSLNLTSLKYVGGNFAGSYGNITSFNVPALETIVGNCNPTSCPILTSINFSSLKSIGAIISPTILASLTSLTFPVIERILGSISIVSGTAALTTFTLGSSLKQIGIGTGNVVLSSCALNQASVDDILVRLAALDGTGGTTTFNSRTVTITGTSSTPSATGLAAKSTLVARGCTVTNN
jgi:hypothetical protein